MIKTHHCLPGLVIASILAVLPTAGARGQDGDSSKEPKTLRELMDASIKWYEVYPHAEAKEPAEVLTALRWANNTRGSEDGITLLFVQGGRPLAACCIYPWAKRLEHDFESLSRDKIVGRRGDKVVWQPQTAGITFADLLGAPAPAGTRAARLRQMKSLAEKFQATLLGWKADNSDREELRLLSRPLYRYDPKEGEVTDGAIFAFVMGTDPEVLMLLEAVKEGDTSKWQYAFARRTSGELEARLGNTVVWKAARYPQQSDPRKPHFTLGTPIPLGLEPSAETPPKSKEKEKATPQDPAKEKTP